MTSSTVDYYVDGINPNWQYCSCITVHFSLDWLLRFLFTLFCLALFVSPFLLCWMNLLSPLGHFTFLHYPVSSTGVPRSLAALSRSLVTLTCPPVLGDYVLLYWEYPDSKRMELIFQFDRWRQSYTNQTKPHLHLKDPASLAAAGNFSFLLSPALKDGGFYLCEVFLDDKAFSQANRLSVLHGSIFCVHLSHNNFLTWHI